MDRKEILRKSSLVLLAISTLGALDSLHKVNSQPTLPSLTTPLDTSSQAEQTDPTAQKVLKPNTFIDQFITPFWKEAQKRREDRILVEPSSNFRIDWELGEKRFNILLLGFGETHEPPLTERAEIGSLTIASFDMSSSPLRLDLISFTHDIRAPEIERYKKERGNWDGNPIKIFRAYPDGGFILLRKVMENASGLPIDYQITFDDGSLKELTDDVFEGVDVEVPMSFTALPFYLDGQKYPEGIFEKGRERMDGLRVLQFIKTVPQVKSSYPKELEHNFRKHLFLKGLASKLKENKANPMFLWRSFQFLRGESIDGEISADFDLRSLLLGNLLNFTPDIGGIFSQKEEEVFPEIRKSIYIVDSAHGDGGVQWVNASQSPAVRSELSRKFYPDGSFEVPQNANPNAEDLITGYWRSTRDRIKTLLLR